MRSFRRPIVAFALLVALAPAATIAAEPSPSPAPDLVGALQLREADAVARVRALDPRYAGIADWTDLARESARTFQPHTLLASNVRVLPSVGLDFALAGVPGRTPTSTLIAVTLVRDCVAADALPAALDADPCAWRHTWLYRVAPDGTISMLFDEGDPDAG